MNTPIHIFTTLWMLALSVIMNLEQPQEQNNQLSIARVSPSIAIDNSIIYVNQAATGSNDGTNWQDAYVSLQDALSAACAANKACHVWVAQGTYFPDEGIHQVDNDRSSTFQLCNNVALYGGFKGTELLLNERSVKNNLTILSGDIDADNGGIDNPFDPEVDSDANTLTPSQADHINGSNAFNVVTASSTDNSAILDGFTITGGGSKPQLIPSFTGKVGSGIFIEFGSPIISNLIISGNSSSNRGGGIFNVDASPILTNVTIYGNFASDSGGGIFNNLSFPILNNVTISGNRTLKEGGGLYNSNSKPILTNVFISGNIAADAGGGMFNTSSSESILTGVVISGNFSDGLGGGLFNSNSNPILTNVTISGNNSRGKGGGIYNTNANPILTNVIIWNNSESNDKTETIGASISDNDNSSTEISFSIIDNFGSAGTIIDKDPRFVMGINPVDAPTFDGDFRLFYNSIAINRGNNTADLDGIGKGTETIADITNDLAGNPRILGGIVDIGAYEQEDCPSGNNLKVYVNAANITFREGLNWDDAYNNIQDALNEACNCPNITEVWVAQGTYYPDEGIYETQNNRESSFQLCDNVALYGGFAGTENALSQRDIEKNPTILSGDIDADNGGADSVFALEVDSDGNSNTASQTDHINGSNAFHVVTGSGTNDASLLNGFIITGGNADGASNSNGGGILTDIGSPTITNVTIYGNHADEFGGGLFNNNASPRLTNVKILGNSAEAGGGGLYNTNADAILINVLVSANNTSSEGGGIANSGSSPIITNVTITANSSGNSGGGVYNVDGSTPIIANTIIWNNSENNGDTESTSASILDGSNSNSTISFSIIDNFSTQGTVKNIDPLFILGSNPGAPIIGDFRLHPTSPAIDMGDNTADLDGPGGNNQTINRINTDLSGDPRKFNAIVDIGAYEFVGCPLDDSGVNILYVNKANNNPGNGFSWATAFNNLQDGLEVACNCEKITEVWVAQGTYYPDEGVEANPDDQMSTFRLCNNVAIYGGFEGTESSLGERDFENNFTILSGDIDSNDAPFAPDENSDSNGNTPSVTDHINGNNAFRVVSGLDLDSTSILDGFIITGGDYFDSDPFNVIALSFVGGGIYFMKASPIISNVTISGNRANQGGGIFISDGSPTLEEVIISSNLALNGGGIFNVNASSTISNVVISGNSATQDGGGIFNVNASSTISNVVISGNSATQDGGGIFNTNADPILTNLTISGNLADQGGGIFNKGESIPTLTNVIIWGNRENIVSPSTPGNSILNNGNSSVSINFSIIELFPDTGTIKNVDPLFVSELDPLTAPTLLGDFRLQPTSPARNMGDNTADLDGVESGTQTIADIATDLDGTLRILEGIVDIGAYEFLGCPSDGGGNIIYVNAAKRNPGNGFKWSSALNNLQAAIELACNCEGITEIWVAQGTYYPDEGGSSVPDDPNSTFQLCNNVAIYGGFAGTESRLRERDIENNPTILSGDIDADNGGIDDDIVYKTNSDLSYNTSSGTNHIKGTNTFHVVTSIDNDSTVILDGFTITGGDANGPINASSTDGGGIYIKNGRPTVSNMSIIGNRSNRSGGGIFIEDADATFTDVVVSYNSTESGGGMFNRNANATFSNVTFSNNSASLEGGGIVNVTANPTFTNVTISNNSTVNGGGMFNFSANPILTDVTILENYANNGGGGMDNFQSNPTLTNVVVSGNRTIGNGAGIFNRGGSEVIMTNVGISGNRAAFGGGIYNSGGDLISTNVTISGNWAIVEGGGVYNENDVNSIFTNTIIWNNSESNGHTESIGASIVINNSNTTFNFSIIDNFGNQGTNKDIDPLFISAIDPNNAPSTAGDLGLQLNSPAINMGDNTADLDGTGDSTQTITDIANDLSGKPRILQSIVDIGAFEQLTCPNTGDNLKIYVNTSNDIQGDGLSWNSAYNKLQNALFVACGCPEITEVWVAQGTYFPDEGFNITADDRNSSFELCNNVTIYGGFIGIESVLSERDLKNNLTILSGDIDQNDSQSPIVTNISNLTGNGNNAYHVVSEVGTDSTAILDGFTITSGNANGNAENIFGGGMYTNGGSPTITNIQFSGNNADSGGGMFNNLNSSPRITNTVFSGNNANSGGGMYNFIASPVIINTVFSGNNADSGGGMFNSDSSPIITNSVFTGNNADLFGGGMYNNLVSRPRITNSIIWNNQQNGNANIDDASITNIDSTSRPRISYSIIANSFNNGIWEEDLGNDLGNNIDSDPLFIIPVNPDNAPTLGSIFTLEPNSPAINMGNNDVDLDGNRDGIQTIADIVSDLAGNSRILQDIVDIGALEQLSCTTSGNNSVIYVNGANNSPSDGMSWENALNNLQDALNLACNCSEIKEIWVAQGTYYPDEGNNVISNDINSTFQLCNNVAIYGGFSGIENNLDERDYKNNITILSGDIDADNGGMDADFAPEENSDGIKSTSPLTDHIIGENAFSVVTGSGTNTTAKLDGFTIKGGNSTSTIDFIGPLNLGAGIFNQDGSPSISNVIISGNRATLHGGGIYNNLSNPVLTNVTISNNVAISRGGGIYNILSNPVLTNVIISGNLSGSNGGGIFNDNADPVLVNVLLSGNRTDSRGGGISNNFSNSVLTNVTISGNYSRLAGGGIHNSNASTILNNTIVWNNSENNGNLESNGASIVDIMNSVTTINFSIIDNFGTANTNKDIDPLFNMGVDPFDAPSASGNFSLQPTSPAINMGDNTANLNAPGLGIRTIADLDSDLAGNLRVFNGTVDIGAYEYLSCPSEGSNNNVVYVDASNGNPGNGFSWAAAFDNLQDGLQVACNCEKITEVWVAQGTYYPDEGGNTVLNNRNSSFQLCNSVAIYGGFVGTENNLNQRAINSDITFLSGDIDQNNILDNRNAFTVVNASGTNNTAVLDGFTITGGNSNGSSSVISSHGGGIFNVDGAPVISNVVVTENNAEEFGGGIYNIVSSDINLIDVSITSNTAKGGGGIFNAGSDMSLTGVIISGNRAIESGGGINNLEANLGLTNVRLSGNSANSGAALFNDRSSESIDITLTNVTVSGNSAGRDVGGIFNDDGNTTTLRLTNVIIWNNSENGNTNSMEASLKSLSIIANNSIVDNFGSLGSNKDIDPLFVMGINPDNAPTIAGDFSLQFNSPAINMGDNAANIGGGLTIADIATDLAGNPRIFSTTVDIGAYETICFAPDNQSTLYVNKSNTNPLDGFSWDGAFNNLQDALEVACNCSQVTEIWVAQGTYYPDEGGATTPNSRASTFQLCDNVAIYGGFTGGESNLNDRNFESNITTLSGDLEQDNILDNGNAFRVVSYANVGSGAILDGFNITAGNASGSGANRFGAGININNSSPVLSNLVVSGNNANNSGGGLYITNNSSPVLTNILVSGNSAGSGAGLNIQNSNPVLTNVTIASNNARNSGGGIVNRNASDPIINNSIIWNNRENDSDTESLGASILNLNNSSPIINFSIIDNFGEVGTNKDIDPVFIMGIEPTNTPTTLGNFRLQPNSPAINMGDNSVDLDGPGSGIQTIADIPVDLAGNPRLLENIVDIGAYEQLGCTNVTLVAQILELCLANPFDLTSLENNITSETGIFEYYDDESNLINLPQMYTAQNGEIINVVFTLDDTNCTYETTITLNGENILPTAMCQDITIQLDDQGTQLVVAADIDGGSTDDCEIESISADVTSFDCSNVGNNTVTLTVIDVNSNSSTCTANVTVEDKVEPTAICQSITIQLDGQGTQLITASNIDGGSTDACGIASTTIDKASFDCSNIGINLITLTVTDVNANVNTCTSNVMVESNLGPNADCSDITAQLDGTGNVIITASDPGSGSNDPGAIANISIEPSSFDCSDIGLKTITVTTTFINGDVETYTSEVTVEDNISPGAVCRSIIKQLDATGNASITAADIDGGSFDNCGIENVSIDRNTFDCNNLGLNPVTLTAIDVNGNSSTCIADVIVVDNVPPTAVCNDITIQLNAQGEQLITPSDVNGGSSNPCLISSISLDNSFFDCSNIGSNTITLTVTEVNGNISTCTSIVEVEDNQIPTALCQDITIQLNDQGTQLITASDIDGGSLDNCGIASLSIDKDVFDPGDLGSNTVTLTVNDVNGNVSNCTGNVTVEAGAFIANIEVTYSLQGNGGNLSNNGGDSFTVIFYQNGDVTPVFSFNSMPEASESKLILTGIPPGTYDIFVKHNTHLRTAIKSVSLDAGNNTLDFGVQKAGDINNDNFVSLLDFSALSSAYNAFLGDNNYLPAADLNFDDFISLLDFSLLSSNYNEVGEELPAGN